MVVGNGAAPDITQRSDEVSYFRRVASGTSARRRIWVGTMNAEVIRSRSISARISSASNFGPMTIDPPIANIILTKAGAAEVIERTHHQVMIVVVGPDLAEHVEHGAHSGVGVVAARALGLSGSARGVHDHAASLVSAGAGYVLVGRTREGLVPVTSDDDIRGWRELDHRQRLVDQRLVDLVADHRLGARVVEDVSDLGSLEASADLNRRRGDPRERLARDHVLDAVTEHDRDTRLGVNAGVAQRVR